MPARLCLSLLAASLCSGCFLFQPSSTATQQPGGPTGAAGAPESSGSPSDSSGGTGTYDANAGGSEFAQQPAAPAAAPEPPRPVSVTLRNSCKQTVKTFFGDTPKFGSGRYSSMSSNSVTSSSFMPGDMFWIVDDGQNGLSSVTVGEGMREIEILEGCTGMRTR